MSIATLTVITLVTIVFAFDFNETLFRNLPYFEFKYKKIQKQEVFG